MNTAEFRALISRKVGPLPIGAWLVVVAVGVAATAAIIRKRRGPAAEPVDADDVAAPGTETSTPNPFNPGGFAVPGGGVAGTGQGVSPDPFEQAPPEQRTNTDWEVDAVRYLIARGITPTVAQSAVAKFLSSESVNEQELAAINLALRSLGPTPEPVAPATLTQTPAPVTNNPQPPPSGNQQAKAFDGWQMVDGRLVRA